MISVHQITAVYSPKLHISYLLLGTDNNFQISVIFTSKTTTTMCRQRGLHKIITSTKIPDLTLFLIISTDTET